MAEAPGAELLTDEDRAAIALLSDMIVEKLGQSTISSVLPAHIGDWIRETAKHRQVFWTNSIPMASPGGMVQNWMLNPDGTMMLELRDVNNQIFWYGTFRPAGE